jgi:transcriptional regulator with XRE-family HTH domain
VLRHRTGMRQSDVARAAAVSQSLVSVIEAGRLGRVCFDDLRRVFAAVGAGFDGNVVWRGAALDRLLDARHAAIVAASVTLLERRGWQVHPEVSYSIFR